MLDRALWKLFESTGRVDVYLLYRGYLYDEDNSDNKDINFPKESMSNSI